MECIEDASKGTWQLFAVKGDSTSRAPREQSQEQAHIVVFMANATVSICANVLNPTAKMQLLLRCAQCHTIPMNWLAWLRFSVLSPFKGEKPAVVEEVLAIQRRDSYRGQR